MSAKLPSMVYNAHTRISGEVLWYYNLGIAQRVGALVFDGTTTQRVQEASCADALALPASGFSAAVVVVPNRSVMKGTGQVDTFPIASPIGAAGELVDVAPSLAIGSYSFGTVPTVAGDQLDIFALPNPADDVLICYDQGVEPTQGEVQRAIKRKLNPADHYVRQRPDNKITMTDLLQSCWKGISRLGGNRVTIIARAYPDGGSVPVQISYFTNVLLSVSGINSGGEANDSVEIKAEGAYNQRFDFAPQS